MLSVRVCDYMKQGFDTNGNVLCHCSVTCFVFLVSLRKTKSVEEHIDLHPFWRLCMAVLTFT